jgi:hypothetical protein
MERTPSSKKCGYVTSKGKKCKNPSESCRFHCSAVKKGRTTPKSDSPKKRGRVAKSVSPRSKSSSPMSMSPSIEIDRLNDLTLPSLYQILLKIPRAELNEICKSSSKLRMRGKLTNIEKICRNDRFQKEYSKKHGGEIFEDEILFLGRNDRGLKEVRDSKLRIEIDEKIDMPRTTGEIYFDYGRDGYMNLARVKHGNWKVDTDNRPFFIQKTGRPKLFSSDKEVRTREVESFLKQISDEVERKCDKIKERERVSCRIFYFHFNI